SGRDGVCERCGHRVSARRGYLDLIDGRAGEPTPSSPEQRLMESELVARAYDRLFRPAFVRVLAGSGAGSHAGGVTGELFIHKSCLALDERDGPWLDLSCGPGAFARAMAAAAPGALVVGADISRAMLEVAAASAKGYANLALVRADAHDLPFADKSFTGVNNAGSLHVYDDPEAVFGEVWRVLSPGGVYVGSTFSRASSVLGRTASKLAGIRRFDPPELRAWLSRLGFSDYEDIRFSGAFIFRARRP
ncbi:MAG TPA: methyltransferase domain-containing protein, partial [Kofleriaceae bacterium]|nr:methyltransferase domain-containing protein [Kofleriaceae bacterium]